MASVPRVAAAAAAATATVLAASSAVAAASWYSERASCLERDEDVAPFRINSNFMQHIHSKSYLDSSSKDGLPSTLRILAVDLPEMRTEAFHGTCRIAHSGVYVDDVAPPKVISFQGTAADAEGRSYRNTISNSAQLARPGNGGEQDQVKLYVAQKSLVKALIHCHSSQSPMTTGVSLLEASVEDMNVHRIRRTHQFGSFKHDPGKYYSNAHTTNSHLEKVEKAQSKLGGENDGVEKEIYIETEASFEDEMSAPWNQYAWVEELSLRLTGKVSYGAPMERSSRLSQALGLGVYKTMIPSSRRWWLPSFLQGSPDGLDSAVCPNCRASNKPHAVIANGAALQLVPSSLRLLQKLCRDADVPLYVIHDPRIWGGNTHHTLSDALREMRQTIKKRIISQALKEQGSSAFARGRLVGQVETNAKWQAKERAQKFFSYNNNNERQKFPDWSKLDEERLENKLAERKVIRKTKLTNGEMKRTYSPGMKAIVERCAGDAKISNSGSEKSPVVSAATAESPSTQSTAKL